MCNGPPLEVRVWGDFACFTRPEMKVERVSYDIMTPSAARGILEAIFWKPEFAWRIREIHVLRPIKHFSILRNEVNTLASERAARGWEKEGGGFFADEDRTQRHTLALRDVAYNIRADMSLKPHATDDIAKYRDQFRRRVARGQCHHQPCLGCREFAASFSEPVPGEHARGELNDDLGRMLFDVLFSRDEEGPVSFKSRAVDGAAVVQGKAQPKFFQARLEHGVLRVPQELYEKEG